MKDILQMSFRVFLMTFLYTLYFFIVKYYYGL